MLSSLRTIRHNSRPSSPWLLGLPRRGVPKWQVESPSFSFREPYGQVRVPSDPYRDIRHLPQNKRHRAASRDAPAPCLATRTIHPREWRALFDKKSCAKCRQSLLSYRVFRNTRLQRILTVKNCWSRSPIRGAFSAIPEHASVNGRSVAAKLPRSSLSIDGRQGGESTPTATAQKGRHRGA